MRRTFQRHADANDFYCEHTLRHGKETTFGRQLNDTKCSLLLTTKCSMFPVAVVFASQKVFTMGISLPYRYCRYRSHCERAFILIAYILYSATVLFKVIEIPISNAFILF